MSTAQPAGEQLDYPEDWQEQDWCCRTCAAMAWYAMSPELRRELRESIDAQRAAATGQVTA